MTVRTETDDDQHVRHPRPQLAARRAAVSHTQESLAESLSVSPSTVARWEQGAATPRPWQRPKLAAKLAVTLDEIDQLLAGERANSTRPFSPLRTLARGEQHAFFGTGPVTIALPLRQTTERPLPVISSEDALAAHRLAEMLASLSVEAGEFRIPPHGIWEPPLGDVVAICGPKSSPVIAKALSADPYLAFEPDGDGRWTIRKRAAPVEYFSSPMDHDDGGATWADVAYIGRVIVHDKPVLVVAGIHALGSLGAVDYLTHNLADLHARVGLNRFSMAVRSEHDGEAVIMSEPICPPHIHP